MACLSCIQEHGRAEEATCQSCGEPGSDFNINNSKDGGLRGDCRDCQHYKKMLYLQNHPNP